MEEKTERLRDIFMDVADGDSVTETQTEQRGSLVRTGSVDDRLEDVVGRMRERFDFETDLDDEDLCAVVKRFYDGETDGEIAEVLGCSPEDVFAARMDLHLVREDDAAGVDRTALGDHLDGGATVAEAAAALEESAERVARARRVLEAERERRRVSHRFRTAFEEVLTDADIAVQLTAEVRDDGLDEAAEDIETDVDF